jgi:hypothetical protein
MIKKFLCAICGRGPAAKRIDIPGLPPIIAGEGVLLYRYSDQFYCKKDLSEFLGSYGFVEFLWRRRAREARLKNEIGRFIQPGGNR